jgi:hypothetical protein
MSNVASFVGQYNEGNGSSANNPFLPNTSGALGMQEISGILKQIYDGQKLAVLYYKNNPAWAMFRKKEDFYGETYPLTTIVETPTGIANIFANAQLPNQLINGGSGIGGNQGPPKFQKFMLTRASAYGIHVIDRQAMLSASNNIGAFVNGQMATMDAMIQGTTNLLSTQLFRSGSGSIGQINSIGPYSITVTTTNTSTILTAVSSFTGLTVGGTITGTGIPAGAVIQALNPSAATITMSLAATASATITAMADAGVIQLVNPTDVRYFTVGQVMLATNVDPIAGATVTQRAGYGYVIALNRAAGQVTVGLASAANPLAPALPTGWVVGDYLAINGTSPLNGPTVSNANTPVALTGLQAWIGNSQNITATDVFFGVNRSVDVWRLGGGFYDGSQNGQSVEEALYDGSTSLFMEGGYPSHCFVGPNAYAALQKSYAARNIFETQLEGPKDESGTPLMYFKGITMQGAGSEFIVIADRNCPPYSAFLLTLEDWAIYSLKAAPHVVDDDGVSFLRQTSADAFEFRLACYAQVGCSAPGHSMFVKLSI